MGGGFGFGRIWIGGRVVGMGVGVGVGVGLDINVEEIFLGQTGGASLEGRWGVGGGRGVGGRRAGDVG